MSFRFPLNISKRALAVGLVAFSSARPVVCAADHFESAIRPLLAEYCQKCHSTEKQKGDLDLERFTTSDIVKTEPHVWQLVQEQLELGEMPPKNKPQPTAEQRRHLLEWVHGTLMEVARAHAGDPGPVVLRRLSNAEYTATMRDLTGVDSLDPTREFPEDNAAGEGFTNAGAALVMSPALLGKYLEAAKAVARHAVLLPDGIRFSPQTSERDWTEETLAAIRGFYARFTTRGGGTGVNLQGIKFDTNDGGVLPLEKYLAATLEERTRLRNGTQTTERVAQPRALNAKYLDTLFRALDQPPAGSVILDEIRKQWREAAPDDAARIAATIGAWQKALWRFTTVGHIGKRDGPKAWQIPTTPLTARREVRVKLPRSADGTDVVVYLIAADAGDGSEHDDVAWENLRLVAPGRPDLPLTDLPAAVRAMTYREKIFTTAAACLAAVNEIGADARTAVTGDQIAQLAQKHGVDRLILTAWIDYLGINHAETKIDALITQKIEKAQNYEFINGWGGADALSVIANASDQHVRVPGNMKPHGVAVHPAPNRRVLVSWRSPVAGMIHVTGSLQHAHPECGNGVAWWVELRHGKTRQPLASGTAQGAASATFGPFSNLAVQSGDVVTIAVGPRDGNHACDLTAIECKISDGTREWDLARDVSSDILAGNPHPDRFGNANIWHFHSEPDGGNRDAQIAANSLLAKWLNAPDAAAKAAFAKMIEELLVKDAKELPKDAPDAALRATLSSTNGPLISSIRAQLLKAPNADSALAADPIRDGIDTAAREGAAQRVQREGARICARAPSAIALRFPAELADGCELVGTATLQEQGREEGSVQMNLSLERAIANGSGLAPDSPIIVADGSAARKRIEQAFDDFRQLFPAALCYTKIVPVDEVVTLTLFYREDEHLRRLMLNEAECAELDRLWSELHYISRDALKLVDAFEQLWQYATQDGDPTAFEPMRIPIKQRAAAFQQTLLATQPAHLEAVLQFANLAWRRPLTSDEQEDLRALYRSLRDKELHHEEALRLTLARVLVAPSFLYKMETPGSGKESVPVNDHQLAARLSYFLWSSAPDPALRQLAAENKLADRKVLVAQMRRMLRDNRVRLLATEFGAQWLHTRGFEKFDEKSERHFPDFNSLRSAMNEEVIRFFTDFFQNDRGVFSLLDADYTFVNAALAKHYDLPPVQGDAWQRVDGIRAHGRGGVLAFAATLAKQSGASRTSPILRGNWVSETLLGERLPRPPKGVPVLPEEPPAGLTERQLTERHSNDPSCARCHVRIDPFGYALESFDAVGRFRSRDANDLPIDTRTKLADGSEMNGLDGLRRYLLTSRRETFRRQFCKKLLGYALGRSVILTDEPLLEEMAAALEKNNQRISTALELIVSSRQFREIRGTENVAEP
jgi:hypothetical protein